MDVIKRVSYAICLDVNDVRNLMGVLNTGVKNSPPRGYDMKCAGPIITELKSFLEEYGKVELEQDTLPPAGTTEKQAVKAYKAAKVEPEKPDVETETETETPE